jgi:hypothetical protein
VDTLRRQKKEEAVFIPKGTDRKGVCLKGFQSKGQPCPQSFLTPSLTQHKGSSNYQQKRRGMLEVEGKDSRRMKGVFLGKTLKFQKSLPRHRRKCGGLTCLWWSGV